MDTNGCCKTSPTGFRAIRLCFSVSWALAIMSQRRSFISCVLFAEKISFSSKIDRIIRHAARLGLRKGIYRGYWAGLATYGPFSAIYFVVYEKWKARCAHFVGASSVDSLSMPYHLGGGVFAGSIAAIVTAPIDAVKTRMQVMLDRHISYPLLLPRSRLHASPLAHRSLMQLRGQVYGTGLGMLGTSAAMLRSDGVAAFTRRVSACPAQPSPAGAALSNHRLFQGRRIAGRFPRTW